MQKGTMGSWEGELGHALTNVTLGGAVSCVVPRLKGLPEQGFLSARVCNVLATLCMQLIPNQHTEHERWKSVLF